MQRGTLQDELERRLPTRDYVKAERALRLFIDVCSAVSAMHALVPPAAHRYINDAFKIALSMLASFSDIKAANVLMSDDERAILMDLGSAAEARILVADRKHAQTITDDCAEHCTMTYRAPELFNVESGTQLDFTHSDVWVGRSDNSILYMASKLCAGTRLLALRAILLSLAVRSRTRTW